MSLIHILVFIIVGSSIGAVSSGKLRRVLLLCASILALYSLQPALPLRAFDFWLPTTAIALTWWIWIATQDPEYVLANQDRRSLTLLLFIIGGVLASSYLPASARLFVSLPVDILDAMLGISLYSAIAWGIYRLKRRKIQFDTLFILLIVLIFIGLKAPGIAIELARAARQLTGQAQELASIIDLNWLGFSYIAFRLLHVLRDYRSSRLPQMGIASFMLYTFFFPALTAGPIDRAERFLQNLSQDRVTDVWAQWQSGGSRVVRGLFLKFVLADSLALVALNADHADLVQSRMWMWLLLYLYSFRIFFDFSGYTDIAIGVGLLTGIQLPENFDHPYRQADIGAFWNRWHITLAQWFRAYVFNPLTRALRQSHLAKSPWLIILIGQLVTMSLIGLWHGITWNFLVWGLWHAGGLFFHNRWLALQRMFKLEGRGGKVLTNLRSLGGLALTFHFVSLGWVWFSTPNMSIAWKIFLKLIGGPVG